MAAVAKPYRQLHVPCDLTTVSFGHAWWLSVEALGMLPPDRITFHPSEADQWAKIAAGLSVTLEAVPDPSLDEYEWFLSRGDQLGYGSPGA